MIRSAVLALLLAVAATPAAVAAEPTFPPGSRIGLVPPRNMIPSKALAGFTDPSTSSAIVMLEMPVDAYPTVASGFTEEGLKAQGFAEASRETLKIGGNDAVLVTGEQKEANRFVPKAVLLATDKTMTALVIAQMPVGALDGTREEIRAALRTVALRPPLTIGEQVAALPFRLGETAGFRPVRAMAGNSLLLTDGAKDAIRGADQPIMIVGMSFGATIPAEQRETLARSALSTNTLLKDVVFERSQGFRQGGAEWHEIVAKGRDAPTDQRVVVLQTIKFEAEGYLRMVGIVREEDREAVMPRFRRLVDSVAIK